MNNKNVYGQGETHQEFFKLMQKIYDQDITAPTQERNLCLAALGVPEKEVEVTGLFRFVDRITDIGLHNKDSRASDNAVILLGAIGRQQDPAAALQGLTKIAQSAKSRASAAYAIIYATSLLERNPSLVSPKAYIELTQVKAPPENDGVAARLARFFSRAARRPSDPVDKAVRKLNKVINTINAARPRPGAGHGW